MERSLEWQKGKRKQYLAWGACWLIFKEMLTFSTFTRGTYLAWKRWISLTALGVRWGCSKSPWPTFWVSASRYLLYWEKHLNFAGGRFLKDESFPNPDDLFWMHSCDTMLNLGQCSAVLDMLKGLPGLWGAVNMRLRPSTTTVALRLRVSLSDFSRTVNMLWHWYLTVWRLNSHASCRVLLRLRRLSMVTSGLPESLCWGGSNLGSYLEGWKDKVTNLNTKVGF